MGIQRLFDAPNYENMTLEEVKQIKITELNSKCTESIERGFWSSILGTPHFFRFNKDEDQGNFTQKAFQLERNPEIETVTWKSEDAGIVVFTREQFFTLIDNDIPTHKEGNIARYWNLKYAVIPICQTKEEVLAVSW